MALLIFGVKINFNRFVTHLVAFTSACSIFAADPVVSNVQAKQRDGSRLVDITYDVADPDSPTLTVYLMVSANGGKTWRGPAVMVSGDVGQQIVPGNGKRLVWDAGTEMPDSFGRQTKYRIGAGDHWLGDLGMALIPAGSFKMGDERVGSPENLVTLDTFAIDKCEVSIELWQSVQVWGKTNGYDLKIGRSFGAKHPVHSVNWYDAIKWNNARSEKEGRAAVYYEDSDMKKVYRSGIKEPFFSNQHTGYGLPTEAEWEKAARGGMVGKLYPWGTDEISWTIANIPDSNKGGTVSVSTYPANGYGLFNMVGNVWEWCWSSAVSKPVRGGGYYLRWGPNINVSNGGVAVRRDFPPDSMPNIYYPFSTDYLDGGFRSVLRFLKH